MPIILQLLYNVHIILQLSASLVLLTSQWPVPGFGSKISGNGKMLTWQVPSVAPSPLILSTPVSSGCHRSRKSVSTALPSNKLLNEGAEDKMTVSSKRQEEN